MCIVYIKCARIEFQNVIPFLAVFKVQHSFANMYKARTGAKTTYKWQSHLTWVKIKPKKESLQFIQT